MITVFFPSRELIPEGSTGGLVIFEDRPNYWDAWGREFLLSLQSARVSDERCWKLDVEIHHLETARPLEFTNVKVLSQGPLRASVRAEVKYDKSTIGVTVGRLACFVVFWFCWLC